MKAKITDGLVAYRAKRKFDHTPEPSGKRRGRKPNRLHFVIQKHAASHLHFDFRLEMQGTLKSWAVPKGVPTGRGQKALAMQVEDHPLEYANFEGTIPEGNYGAGTVMVWDRGTYTVLNGEPSAAWDAGKIEMHLTGKKLKSDWTLVRMRPDDHGKQPWLLIKTGDSIKPLSQRALDRSAKSARSMKQITVGRHRVWRSNRT